MLIKRKNVMHILINCQITFGTYLKWNSFLFLYSTELIQASDVYTATDNVYVYIMQRNKKKYKKIVTKQKTFFY